MAVVSIAQALPCRLPSIAQVACFRPWKCATGRMTIVAMASPKRSIKGGGGGGGGGRGRKKDRKQQQQRQRPRIQVEELGDDDEEEDEDEDAALEALFAELEKDLAAEKAGKKLDFAPITEEQMAALEQELMGGKRKDSKKEMKREKEKRSVEQEEETQRSPSSGDEENQEEDECEEEETGRSGLAKFIEEAQRLESEMVAKRIVKLERWQLRKLKAALDVGKRELKVKALAGEIGLDRRDVLTFLREPPPELLELIDTLSDEEDENDEQDEVSSDSLTLQEGNESSAPTENNVAAVERIGLPGDFQGTGPKSWYGRKRIRKEHLETFEKVYQRTKRPTGALIQNMVELTHVPRKRVMDWFEKRRQEDAIRREASRREGMKNVR